MAWDVIKGATKFYIPPRPPGIGQDSNQTSIDQNSDNATIEFYDPDPIISEEAFTATHSADWRWEVGYGVNPGWNYVRANREVDVGESYWYDVSGWSFGKERTHQLAMGTAFCIYTEDETACETDGGGCGTVCPTDDDLVTELRECCQLDDVEDPIPVSDTHLQAARDTAREVADSAVDRSESPFEEQAVAELSTASEEDRPLRSLIAYRSASAHASGANARRQFVTGERTTDPVRRRGERLRSRIRRTHDSIRYRGDTLEEAVAKAGQVEKRLLSARAWIDSAEAAFDQDYLDDAQLKYAESGMEFAAGNLEDATYYLGSAEAPGPSSTDRATELDTLATELRTSVQSGFEALSGSSDPDVAYALENVRSHLDRAAERRENGYHAAASVDAVYAYGYEVAARRLAEADVESVDRSTLEVEQELTADRFNRRVAAIDGDIERLLLKMASHEYNTGVESFGTFAATEDRSEADRAYRHYAVTNAFLDCADLIYEDLEVSR